MVVGKGRGLVGCISIGGASKSTTIKGLERTWFFFDDMGRGEGSRDDMSGEGGGSRGIVEGLGGEQFF